MQINQKKILKQFDFVENFLQAFVHVSQSKYIISTESALRLPITYDNHPSQFHPTHI